MLIYKENTKVVVSKIIQYSRKATEQSSIFSNISIFPTVQDISLHKYIKTHVSSTLEFTDLGFFQSLVTIVSCQNQSQTGYEQSGQTKDTGC